jgi:hypothetical protein
MNEIFVEAKTIQLLSKPEVVTRFIFLTITFFNEEFETKLLFAQFV